jgi:hypothetical protein
VGFSRNQLLGALVISENPFVLGVLLRNLFYRSSFTVEQRYKRVTAKAVPMRMVLTDGVPYHASTFCVTPTRRKSKFVHSPQDGALHRLEAVSIVRNSTLLNHIKTIAAKAFSRVVKKLLGLFKAGMLLR